MTAEKSTEHLREFLYHETILDGIRANSSRKNSSHLQERNAYRDYANTLSTTIAGAPVISVDSPDSAVDTVYNTCNELEEKVSGAFWEAEKIRIVDQADSKRLADGVYSIDHAEIEGNAEHNKIVDKIIKYQGLLSINHLYDHGGEISPGRKVTLNDLLNRAREYVASRVKDGTDGEKHIAYKLITNEDRAKVVNGILASLATSSNRVREVTDLMQEEARVGCEELLKDDAIKAKTARNSLLNNPQAKVARNELYRILTAEAV